MSRPLITDPEVVSAIAAIPDEPVSPYDPRVDYLLGKEATYRAWPCAHKSTLDGARCLTRRDEHADQVEGRWSSLDITDHPFQEGL